MVIASGPGSAEVSRAAGQRLARAELSKSMYHPGVPLIQQIIDRVRDAFDRLLNSVGVPAPGLSWWAVVALAALLVLAAAAVVIWLGPVARSRRGVPGAVLAAGGFTARDHRERAERMAAAGDYTAAVIESVRAIALGLEERGVLAPRSGRTAVELAAEASGPLPGHADGLSQAARLFDDVRYGGRDGTAEGYQQMRDLDASLRAARPAMAAADSGMLLAAATAGPVP